MGKLKFGREKICYLVELLILLALVVSGVAKQPETVFQTSLLGQSGGAWQSESFPLSPGVYEIRIEAALPADASLNFSVVNQVPRIFRDLLANELTMQAGETSVSGRITVTAALEQVCLQIVGSSNVAVKSITVERTGQWNLVLAVCLLIGITLVNLLVYLRQRITSRRINGEQQLVVWGLAAAVAAAVFPSLTDYITINGDTMWYLTRMEALAEGALSLQDGPGFLAIPAFFRMLGFTVQTSWQFFLWGCTILTAVSTYCCLWFCCRERKAALLVTVLFLLSPLRVVLLYEEGNLSGWLGLNLLVLPAGALLWWLCKTVRLSLLLKILTVLAVITVSITFYQLNDLAFHLAPEYLYEMSVWGWESQERVAGTGSMIDMAADAAVLLALVILVTAVWGSVRRGGKHHEDIQTRH